MVKIADDIALDKVLKSVKEKPGRTADEIIKAIGLTWDIVVCTLAWLCQNKVVTCVPRPHAEQGIRAEYFPQEGGPDQEDLGSFFTELSYYESESEDEGKP